MLKKRKKKKSAMLETGVTQRRKRTLLVTVSLTKTRVKKGGAETCRERKTGEE